MSDSIDAEDMTRSTPDPSADPPTPPTPKVDAGRRRITAVVIAASVFAIAAVVGAYLDWVMWIQYKGLMITLGAGALLLVGAIVALIGRGTMRRVSLLVLAAGIGLVAGQNLGPSREPLIDQSGGRMILRLESPVVGVATGTADCSNVASETEFAVSGDPNMRLDTAERAFVDVYVNVGDRWDAIDDAPRKNGVRLEILATPERVGFDGVPSMVVMGATESSTLEATFSNDGGSIRFADLELQTRQGFTGAPIDLAGTLEWTCGTVTAASRSE